VKKPLLVVSALLFCLGATHTAAQRAERVTAPFWRAVRDPESTHARALLRQASSQLKRAARLLPVSWETVCRRIVTIPLSADNQQVRAGRLRALEQLLPHARSRQEHLDEAFRKAPDDYEVLYMRGVYLLKQQRFAPAQEILEKALDLRPSDSIVLVNLGKLYFLSERREAGLRLLEKAGDAQGVLVHEHHH